MKTIAPVEAAEKEFVGSLPNPEKPIWWIKLTNWEFWPFNIFYLPFFFYYAWLSLKARSLFFFSASNPGIEYGGMLGESKIKILDKFQDSHKPTTILVQPGITLPAFDRLLVESSIKFPFILKPDVGERGWGVKKIATTRQLETYLSEVKVPFLLQELVDKPIELGIFYARMPDEERGKVTSIVIKEMLTVTGDGSSNVRRLLSKNPRSVINLAEIKKTSGDLFNYTPDAGEKVEVVPIGNHCRGTTFLDGNALINAQVSQAIDEVAKQHPGFYFGRMDARCDTLDDLKTGRIKIFELNGAGAEPGHIYQPGYSLLKAYQELRYHQSLMYRIAKKNHQLGVPYMTFKEGLRLIKYLRNYNKLRH